MTEAAKSDNRLLSELTPEFFQHIFPKMERIALNFAEDIYQSGDIIKDVYFPESGIVSLLSSVEKHSTLEVGIVGNEGMIGIAVFLGVKTSTNHALVQGTGMALRMSAKDFLGACETDNQLPQFLKRFTHSLLNQFSQSAVCYRFHQIEPRLARWLLMTHDRMQSDEFRITQEFLSNMLGVRREAVNKAAKHLQKEILISYKRGNLKILDRINLEKVACPCYQIIKHDYDNFLN